jgi:Asp-tRNA(Asn)/Glu-tRNA(Gln) amidotransferase A subunit family amidase
MPAPQFRPELRSYTARTQAFATGSETPRQFLERSLETLSEIEPNLRAFVSLDTENARRQADLSSQRWRAGRPLSPIDGMPIGIKDVIETIDMPTEMGSRLFQGWRSDRDAASVYALREAGAVLVGKTVTTEFAATEAGPTANPWDFTRTPGGSSSGTAAAVGAGILSAGLGTQVIGSIIRPAGYCGCVGFKPTVGALNRGGSHDYMSQSCLGVIGASLADTWQVAHELVKRCGGDPGFAPLDGPDSLPLTRQPKSVALLETAGWDLASDQSKAQFGILVEKLEAKGATVVRRATSPLLDKVEQAIAQALRLSQKINAWESRWPLNTYAERDKNKLSAAMQKRLVEAESMTVSDYRNLTQERCAIRELYAQLASECDVCLTLPAPCAAPVGLSATGNPVFAVPASLLGVPAVSIPVLWEDGLPLGLQLLGFAGCDEALFSNAAFMESLALA